MDSILSSVLSIFSHNPIFVLGIIAYIAFSIIKNKNTEESEEYDEYESSSGGTWEDMEREYGISIEQLLLAGTDQIICISADGGILEICQHDRGSPRFFCRFHHVHRIL